MSSIYIPKVASKIDLSAYATKAQVTSQLLDKATVSQPVTFNGVTSTASLKVNQQLVMNTTTVAATAYATLATDYCLLCSNINATAITLTTPAAGTILRIKDSSGQNRTITITPDVGTIDGAASLVLPSAYNSTDLIFDGTSWFTL